MLHGAAADGRAAVVELLISAGATVDPADKDGGGLGRVYAPFFGGSVKVMEGVCTLAGDFRSLLWDVEWCLLF